MASIHFDGFRTALRTHRYCADRPCHLRFSELNKAVRTLSK